MLHEGKYVNNLELCFEFKRILRLRGRVRSVARRDVPPGWPRCSAPSGILSVRQLRGIAAGARRSGRRAAVAWQSNTESPAYYNNCTAAEEEAAAAMKLSGATSFSLVKGWFNETVPRFTPPSEIAVLRLDGDWYDSTRVCLENLYPHVAPGGIVIVDDYYNWDGCARAVNEFLAASASTNTVPRFRQFHDRAAYLIKPNPVLSATNGSALPDE